MRTVLVVAVIAVVGVLTFFLTRDEEIVSPPPVVEDVVPTPLVVAAPSPSAEIPEVAVVPVEAVDAGRRVVEVSFEVTKGGAEVPGARVTLFQGRDSVSGLVDVMGDLKLSLAEGVWKVSGDAWFPREITVSAQTRVVKLEQRTEKSVHGRVVTADKKPVSGATVELVLAPKVSMSLTTKANGRFSFDTFEKKVTLSARHLGLMSEPVTVDVSAVEVELVIEPTHPVEITLADVPSAVVVIAHRLGGEIVNCRSHCSAAAPVGDYTLTAAALRNGEIFMARAIGTQGSKGDDKTLKFEPAPPIVSGVVTKADGTPLADVPLKLVPAFRGSVTGSSVLTKRDGSFEFDVRSLAVSISTKFVFPTWVVQPQPPWSGEAKYVSFGDAPITLVAEVPGDAAR